MKKEEIAFYEAQKRHQRFNSNYSKETLAVKGYAKPKKVMDDNVLLVEAGNTVQHAPGETDADTVDLKKRVMSTILAQYMEGSAILATLNGNTALANLLTKPMTYFYKADKDESVKFAEASSKILSDNMAVLENIEVADITKINASILGYDSIKDLPITDIQSKKSHGTDSISTAIANSRKASVQQYGLFHSFYIDTSVDICDELKLAYTPIIAGRRFTPTTITVLDDVSGMPIALAGLSKQGKTEVKSFVADEDGNVDSKTHKSGITTYTAVAPNYKKQVNKIKIVRHKDNKVEIRMKKLIS